MTCVNEQITLEQCWDIFVIHVCSARLVQWLAQHFPGPGARAVQSAQSMSMLVYARSCQRRVTSPCALVVASATTARASSIAAESLAIVMQNVRLCCCMCRWQWLYEVLLWWQRQSFQLVTAWQVMIEVEAKAVHSVGPDGPFIAVVRHHGDGAQSAAARQRLSRFVRGAHACWFSHGTCCSLVPAATRLNCTPGHGRLGQRVHAIAHAAPRQLEPIPLMSATSSSLCALRARLLNSRNVRRSEVPCVPH
jgi:hypothetical protein